MKSKYIILLLSIFCFTTFSVDAQTYINSNRNSNKANIKKVPSARKVNTHTNRTQTNRVQTNRPQTNRNVNVRPNRHNTYGSNHVNTYNNHHSSHNATVIKRPNRNNIVRTKPNRPVYIKKPTLNRKGYFWVNGYWKWNLNTYIWMDGFWERERANFHWHEGYWEISPNGFFWIEGYWCDLLWE